MSLTVVIPTLDEEGVLEGTLSSLAAEGVEIVVVDGGSRDRTVEIARRHADRVLSTKPGRGAQLAAGARAASGGTLVFLHADTRLPAGFPALIARALSRPRASWGAFRLRTSPRSPGLDLISFGANLRTRFFALPYGDQAVFARREAYEACGGFPDIPLMEDVALAKRLRQTGGFVLLRARATTSARRWLAEGLLKRTLKNYRLLLQYRLGTPPRTLAERYRHIR